MTELTTPPSPTSRVAKTTPSDSLGWGRRWISSHWDWPPDPRSRGVRGGGEGERQLDRGRVRARRTDHRAGAGAVGEIMLLIIGWGEGLKWVSINLLRGLSLKMSKLNLI